MDYFFLVKSECNDGFWQIHHCPKLFRIPDFWPKQNVYVSNVRGYSMYLGMWHTCICKFKKSKFVNKIFKFRLVRRVLGGNYTIRVVYIVDTHIFLISKQIFRYIINEGPVDQINRKTQFSRRNYLSIAFALFIDFANSALFFFY